MSKKTLFMLMSVFMVSILSVYIISLAMTKTVVVVDKNMKMNVKTTSKTIKSMLKEAKIELHEKDKIMIDKLVVSKDLSLENNMQIDILRSKPITISVDGKTIKGATTNKLVLEALDEYDIVLNEYDIVEPSINSVINIDEIIEITRVEKELVKLEESIAYSSVVKMVRDLKASEVKKISDGKDGLKEVTYEVIKEDGKEVSRFIVDEKITLEPRSEIIEKGIDKLYVTSRGKPFRYKEMIYMKSTAYDLSVESCGKLPGEPGYGITFSGTKARPGVIAVDPRVIPLGSKVYVESTDGTRDYGFAIAEDTGSAIKGNRVDIFIGDRSSALRYGVRNVRIYVIEDPVDSELIKGYGK